jgi:hypothetical protein
MTEPSGGPPARFQFSIRLMLVATAAVAAAMAAYRAEHSWQGRLAINGLTVFSATAAILGVIQTSGKLRAFWLGAAFVLIITAVRAFDELDQLGWFQSGAPILESESIAWMFWCASPVNGLLVLLLHWLFWPRPPEPRP